MSPDALKQRVAEAALAALRSTIQPDSALGIGTGSTVNCFIDCLAKSESSFAGAVSSSIQSTERLKIYDINVLAPNDVHEVAVYVDGADEVDASFALIKGGGGALTREKIVASIAKKFVCIVDESKLVECLGAFPIPIEVLPFASRAVATELRQLGGHPKLRVGLTDNGNCILDVHGLQIVEPDIWERTINDIPGVVTNGIFALHRPQEVFIAQADGTVDHNLCPQREQ